MFDQNGIRPIDYRSKWYLAKSIFDQNGIRRKVAVPRSLECFICSRNFWARKINNFLLVEEGRWEEELNDDDSVAK